MLTRPISLLDLRSIDQEAYASCTGEPESVFPGRRDLQPTLKHQADRMPMVLAGRGGGSLTPGRLLDYRERPPEERRACSLYLSLMGRMGVTLPQFGDSDRRLADL